MNYLHFGCSPGELTPFVHVKKLLPGHYMEANIHKPKTFSIFKYYEVPINGKYFSKNEEALVDELEEN